MPLPYEPIESDTVINVVDPASNNTDLPAGAMPFLPRIGVINLIGPGAANKQTRPMEKRTLSLLDALQRLAEIAAQLDNEYLRKNGSAQKTNGAGCTGDIPMNGYKLTGLPIGTLGDDPGVWELWVTKVNEVNAAFTGVPTAPTAPPGTNTTQLATTAFVQAAFASAIP